MKTRRFKNTDRSKHGDRLMTEEQWTERFFTHSGGDHQTAGEDVRLGAEEDGVRYTSYEQMEQDGVPLLIQQYWFGKYHRRSIHRKKQTRMKRHTDDFSTFTLNESMAAKAGLDPLKDAFYVLVHDEVDSVHGTHGAAWHRVLDLAEDVYSDMASDHALEVSGNNDDRYIEEYENAIVELAEDGDLIKIVQEKPYNFERGIKTKRLFGL
jgi:hypothetical protein